MNVTPALGEAVPCARNEPALVSAAQLDSTASHLTFFPLMEYRDWGQLQQLVSERTEVSSNPLLPAMTNQIKPHGHGSNCTIH